ncbi:MAG TPA: hypothetical protein VMW41_04235, partial [Candidatus Bathyarchaeia archaeon]|nr:hypothetical protein [Candidatus Bathyarchaeia archaeon]
MTKKRNNSEPEISVDWEKLNMLAKRLESSGYSFDMPIAHDIVLVELSKALYLATQRLNNYTKTLTKLTFILVVLTFVLATNVILKL